MAELLRPVNDAVHQLAFDIVIKPFHDALAGVPALQVPFLVCLLLFLLFLYPPFSGLFSVTHGNARCNLTWLFHCFSLLG
jgi:hypothetical protein